jgi:hypothetical protein
MGLPAPSIAGAWIQLVTTHRAGKLIGRARSNGDVWERARFNEDVWERARFNGVPVDCGLCSSHRAATCGLARALKEISQ